MTRGAAWTRNLEAPLRDFLLAETGSSAVLLTAAIGALVWVNLDAGSYHRVWETVLSIRVGRVGVAQDLQHWVNDGLMALFFLVIGVEARREFDLGELRDRRRLTLPVVASLGGMLVPIAMYLAINGGHTSAAGWGVAMSTDTAFALGMLAPVGRRFPANLRAFILTVAVADDPGLATAIGPGVSMSFSDGLSDRGEDIGCGNPGYGVIIVGASPALGSATG